MQLQKGGNHQTILSTSIYLNPFRTLLKKAFVGASVEFWSALFGMFCIFKVLMFLDYAEPSAAAALVNLSEPGLMFIHRWLPLFYVPYLVVLPLSIKDIPPSSDPKIFLIIVGGCLATLCIVDYTGIFARKVTNTELVDAEPMEKPSPFSSIEVWAWPGVLLISFVAALVNPTALGTRARTCLPFLLASTVLGYMVGSRLPSIVKKVFHPVIFCAGFANRTAYAFGYFSKSGVDTVLGYYLTKSSSNPGAGDILTGFLGSVILSFAFSMFKQRKLVTRRAADIFTSVSICTVFLLYSTTLVALLVIVEPSLTLSILPKSITVALALCIVFPFEGGNASLRAAVVVVTGLVGVNYAQSKLGDLRFRDPIAPGIATLPSATAALFAKEPEALPFCAIVNLCSEWYIWISTLLNSISQTKFACNGWLKSWAPGSYLNS